MSCNLLDREGDPNPGVQIHTTRECEFRPAFKRLNFELDGTERPPRLVDLIATRFGLVFPESTVFRAPGLGW